MAEVVHAKKSCSINPLKSSAPLGAALAYLGVEGAVPLFHGSQGCTAFAVVLAVRHFKESIPLQTTAMNEAATVLGGEENLEEALLQVTKRMQPKLIGVASTALVETRGEDFVGELRAIRAKRRELDAVRVVFASTPDFDGALEEGFGRATAALVHELVEPPPATRSLDRVNVLPGVHLTPADLEEIRELVESFGLTATILPDLSTSLDGTVPDDYVGTSLGGTPLVEARTMGEAVHTIAIGEHMRVAAEALLEEGGVPYTLLPTLTGLEGTDSLVSLLMQISGRPAPARVRRQRSQLVDAMLDGHFWLGGAKIAIAADPDLLLALTTALASLGAEITTAISSTHGSPALPRVPAARVIVGDLSDLEDGVLDEPADLLLTHSHGRAAAARLGLPHVRVGFPIFDRLGAQHHRSVGYRGTRDFVYLIANELMSQHEDARPDDFEDVLPLAAHPGDPHVDA